MQSRRNTRGLSGAVVALILVIAAVIIAIVVVGFVFGLFGAFTGSGTVAQAGTAFIDSSTGKIIVVLKNTGASTTVTSVTILGQNFGVSGGNTISPGTSTYTIALNVSGATLTSLTNQLQGLKGSSVTITLYLSNGQSVTVSATVI